MASKKYYEYTPEERQEFVKNFNNLSDDEKKKRIDELQNGEFDQYELSAFVSDYNEFSKKNSESSDSDDDERGERIRERKFTVDDDTLEKLSSLPEEKREKLLEKYGDDPRVNDLRQQLSEYEEAKEKEKVEKTEKDIDDGGIER